MQRIDETLQRLKIGKITKAEALPLLIKAKQQNATVPSSTLEPQPTPVLEESVQRYLLQKLQTLLQVDAEQFDTTENFMELGIDSTQLIALVQEVETEIGIELYPTLLFEYQTIASLAAHLAEEYRAPFAQFLQVDENSTVHHNGSAKDQPVEQSELLWIEPSSNQTVKPLPPATGTHVQITTAVEPERTSSSTESIAVIGMAGVFPQSPDVATFWHHLVQKTDLMSEIPADHFDYRPWYDPAFQVEDKLYCKWGSFIDDVDKFDAGFFNISPREAELMDPQLRYLLQVLYQTAEDAGYGSMIRGSHTGVYVGACFHDYRARIAEQTQKVQAHDGTGNAATMLANRPSFYLNLTGPSMAIDTACSSSLFALHHAYTALQNGECEMALAAGVNLILSSAHYRYFCTIGALSPTGRCHTFDERADGYVPGEAIAAVLLKPLQQAIHDGDQIYGIIKGSAVGHGGYTPSITAPSVDGEAKVLLAAWEDAGINPESLGYIEAHGTGTKLGDPIEIAALTKAFRQHTQQQGFCAIGSAKAHIGHTEGAAGITGVIKALLSLRHATIPAMPQFETTNPYIALETSPFTINREPTPWPPQHNRPRRVGVSSFGFGGAYAHLVLEEYAARPETGTPWVRSTTTQQPSTTNYQLPVATLANKASAQPHLIVLSAKNEERLQAYATSLLLFLEQQSQQKRAGDKPAEKRPNLQHMVQAMVAELLGVDPAEIDDTQAFATYGFDAVQLNHLQRLVETQYQCELPPTLVSLHASVAEIVHYLMSSQAQITQTHHAVADPRLSLPDIAYTLQTGREAMEARVALVASTIEELTERLRQYVQQPHADSASPIAGLYQSHTHTGTGPHGPAHLIGGRAGQAFIQVAIDDNDLDRLAQLWVMGVAIDWQLLYPNGNPHRISLPTYPFAKERYWITDQAPLTSAVNGISNAPIDNNGKRHGEHNSMALHPLLHQNTSTLAEQRFSATFTGSEFFLRDHQVQGNSILPGVVTLEMARAAGELAVEEATVTELRNVVWLRPLAVDDRPQEVQLGLQVTEEEMVQFTVQTSDDQAGPVTHSQGTFIFGSATGQAQSIDLAAIRQRCSVTRSAGDCYQQFTQQGLTYGPTFQVITEIVSNETEVLAQLHLPEGVAVEPFHLHPSLLDGALQSVVGLFGATEQQSATRYLPMSLEKLEIVAPLPTVAYAYATCQAIHAETAHFDIVVTDTTGCICAKLHNFTAKAISQTRAALEDSWYYQPFWTRQESSEREQREFAGDIALVMPKELTSIGDALAQHHRQQRVIHLFLGSQNLQHNSTDWEINLADEAGVVSILAVLPPIDTLYFLGGLGAAMITPTTLHELDDQQEQGILNLFRLVKMFVQQRLMDKLTAIKVLTHQAQQLYPTDPIHPAGAALTGFTMSLAREYRAVDISVLDITLETTQAGHPILTVVNIPAIVTASGNQATSILIRHGVSYRQQLAQLILPADPSLLYRQNGVYLILGGAGGIGLETAVHLAQRVEANVVLVGRSVLTAEQEARLQRIRDAGGDYLYCQADGTDLGQMQAVLSEAKAHFGAIHGVIHSALVLDDSSIHTMHESSLRAVLAPKLTGSVVLAEAVKEEPLDFLLFFSSGQSFWGNMGQSNYAAASTFQDAYALYLNQNRPYPVKVINWGYWGSVGVVATDAYRQRLLQQGLQSIQVNDGMMAIDQILAAPLAQVAAIKVDQRVLHQNGLTVERQAKVVAPAYASLMVRVVASLTANVAGLPLDQATLAQEGLGFKQLESFAGAALLQAYQQIPAFLHVDESHDRAALAQRLQILPKYQRFFDATLDILAANDYLIVQGATVATTEKVLLANGASRHQQETLAENHPLLQPHLTLLTTCLQRLPEILQGQISATDVLFPNGSLDLVSEIYQGTAITDHFNRLVACAVQSMIEERLRFLEPGEKIQIIEIGAGNEGTTSFVLETLAPYQTQIDYLYRDISQSFLRHDQHTFGDQYPFVQVGLLDIEKSPIAQDIELNQADIVLGTNVVHATRNIQQTLQNLKALLKANGLLILNEGTRFSAFTTLTFGLLDGWWVFEDKAQRIEHTPFLSTEQWRRALQSAGFTVALGPALSAMDAQAVLLAESDGVIQITGVDPEPLSISPTADLSNSTHIPEREQPKEQPSVVNPAVSTASNGELQRATEAYLQTIFAEMLKSEPERLQVGQTFETFGIDSIVGIEIVNRLRQVFSADISTTILFEYMTLEQLADYFLTHHTDEVTRLLTVTPTALPVSETSVIDPTPQQAIAPKRLFDNQTRFQQPKVAPTEQQREVVEQPAAVDIAVIGLSGRYPMAENLAQFWENLKVGRNCISEIPAERWDHNLYYHPDTGSFGKSQSKWGGFIDDVDTFDAHFFNIPPHEATLMDPQERLFLETVWATIEDAGYSRQALAERQQVGVFVGVMYQHYPFVANDPTMMAMLGSSSYWQIANRISHWFDWEGPSLAIDTACSSSLTAIHLACESIKRGDCEMAVAGGVNLSLHPAKWFVLGQTEMLGSTDRSKSLGDGDGYVPGEGVGAVLLKRLDQAIADHDQIYAVIKGGAINHGGKTASFTVPNPNAQADLIQVTLAKTGVDPQMISYVEVAANGSALGDPIELAGLSKAFQPASDQHHVVRQPNGQDVPATANQAQLHHEPLDQKQWCPIGSVKSNIGHLEAASGISQLTKVLLQLKHQTLVPSINADPVNPHLALEKTPFFIQREMQDWQQPELELDGKLTRVPRRAAVSSFGAGGSNAHLILEEYQTPAITQPVASTGPYLIVLSAKNEERLQAHATNLLTFLNQNTMVALADLAYTLQVGREAMAERLALIVRDHDELQQALALVLQTSNDHLPLPTSIFQGNTAVATQEATIFAAGSVGQELIQRSIAEGDWEKVALFWTKGVTIPWEQLYERARPQRISLPTYPFARQRYWLTEGESLFAAESNTPAFAIPSNGLDGAVPATITRSEPIVPPRTAAEKTLASIWSELLEIEEIGIHDNFFALGGHSLLATRLVSRINTTFHIAYPIHRLFEIQTIAGLANDIEAQQVDQQADAQLREELQGPRENGTAEFTSHAVDKQQTESKVVEGRL